MSEVGAYKALILAAGFGSRLMPLTKEVPKSMVALSGKSLLQRQLDTLARVGESEVTLLGGYKASKLKSFGKPVVMNEEFSTTNMVSSMFCADSLFDGEEDLIVSYGDIVYNDNVLEELLSASGDIVVVSDRAWEDLWSLRMDDILSDVETFKVGGEDKLLELGLKPKSIQEVQGQYIGLVKYSKAVQKGVLDFYRGLPVDQHYDGQSHAQMYMTSFIQQLINNRFDVRVSWIDGGWLEVDTTDDLAIYESSIKAGGRPGSYSHGAE